MKSNIAINNTPERIIIKINFESTQADITEELRQRTIKLKRIYRELKKPVNIIGKKLTQSEKLEIESIIKELLNVEVIFEQDQETNYISDFNARRRQTILEELQRTTEKAERNTLIMESEFNKIIESKFNSTKTKQEEQIEQTEPVIRLELFEQTEEEKEEEKKEILPEKSLGIEAKFASSKTVIVPVEEQEPEPEPTAIEEAKEETKEEAKEETKPEEKNELKLEPDVKEDLQEKEAEESKQETANEPEPQNTLETESEEKTKLEQKFAPETETKPEPICEENPTPKALQPKKETALQKIENTNSLGLYKIKEVYEENIEVTSTKFYKGSLRSGQKLEFEGSIVLIGDVNGGAEIIATGNIAILGTLRGVAHAGASGNKKATIAAVQIKAPQIRIANIVKELVEDEESIQQYVYIENNEIIIE